jgi:hypothetical protein
MSHQRTSPRPAGAAKAPISVSFNGERWEPLNERNWAETRDLLGPIYGWFTGGFDTPVLKEAKALLDQLV